MLCEIAGLICADILLSQCNAQHISRCLLTCSRQSCAEGLQRWLEQRSRLNMAGSQCKQAAKGKTESRRRHSEHNVDTLDQGLQHLSFAKELLDRTWHMASLNPASNLLTRIRPCKASRSCISGLRWHGRTTNIPNRGCELSQEQVQPRVKT